MLLDLFIAAILAYLIGAVPVGAIVSRLNGVDITEHGSGKTGTTNVLRTVGKRAAALVLLGDFLKGSLAVLIVKLVSGVFFASNSNTMNLLGLSVQVATIVSLLAAAGAVAGHVWSLYLRIITGKWSGGRGVATAQGAMFVVNPLVLLIGLLVGIPTIFISRYVSLGSIVGAGAAGLGIIAFVCAGQMDPFAILFIFLSIFIIAAHHDNIQRLLKGTERKIGERAKV